MCPQPQCRAHPHFLRQHPELWQAPLAPPGAVFLPRAGSAEERLVATTWNRLGGLLATLSAELGFDPGLALAVLCAESSGRAFAPDGRLIIRFEAHVFWRLWGAKTPENAQGFDRHFRFGAQRKWERHEFRAAEEREWRAVHQSQGSEWEALAVARRLDDTASLCSISMGGPQLMGFHCKKVGYHSVQEMFAAFSDPVRGERAQILGLFDFLRGPEGESALLRALAGKDLLAFARLYNGPGRAAAYAERIACYEKIFASWKTG